MIDLGSTYFVQGSVKTTRHYICRRPASQAAAAKDVPMPATLYGKRQGGGMRHRALKK
jgi:hypothetical protein